jgi:hypothetical protein
VFGERVERRVCDALGRVARRRRLRFMFGRLTDDDTSPAALDLKIQIRE